MYNNNMSLMYNNNMSLMYNNMTFMFDQSALDALRANSDADCGCTDVPCRCFSRLNVSVQGYGLPPALIAVPYHSGMTSSKNSDRISVNGFMSLPSHSGSLVERKKRRFDPAKPIAIHVFQFVYGNISIIADNVPVLAPFYGTSPGTISGRAVS
jgi:hypothetical protein